MTPAPFIPQANSVDTLNVVVGTLVDAVGPAAEAVAERLGLAERTVRYYLDLAEWLGLAQEMEGSWWPTDRGEAWNDDPDRRPAMLDLALTSHEWVCEVMYRIDEGVEPVDAARDVILEVSDLAESTARRRAEGLAQLLGNTHSLRNDTSDASDSPDSDGDGGDSGSHESDTYIHRLVQSSIDPEAGWESLGDDIFGTRVSNALRDGDVTSVREVARMLDEGKVGELDYVGAKSVATAERRMHALLRTQEPAEPVEEEGKESRGAGHRKDGALSRLQQSDIDLDRQWESLIGDRLGNRVPNRLEPMGVMTIGALARLVDDERFTDIEGLGETSRQRVASAIEELCREAADDPTELSTLEGRLQEAGVPDEQDWDTLLGPNLPTRVVTALEREGVEAIGAVASMIDGGRLTDLSGIGSKTVDRVVEEFERLLELGPDIYRYGEGGRPETIDELVERGLGSLEERAADVLRKRYVDGLTLEDVGEQVGVTRERIRQIEAESIEYLHEIFGDVAAELTQVIRRRLEESRGLLPLSAVRAECDGELSHAAYVVIACHMAGADDISIWKESFLTSLDAEGRSELFRDLRNFARARDGMGFGVADILDWGEESGTSLDQASALELARRVFGIDLSDGPVYAPWNTNQDAVAEALRRVGRAAETDEVRERYEELCKRYPSLSDLNDHALRSQLQHHGAAYNYGHGVYIHVDNLPMRLEQLEEAVDWAVERLEGETDAVSTDTLIQEMNQKRILPPGLTAHLLKSALNERPDIKSLKNTRLVAHRDTFEAADVTMLDRVEDVLREADEPISISDITDALRDYSYAKPSLMMAVPDADFAVRWQHGGFIHRNEISLTNEEEEVLLDAAYKLLPDDGSAASAASTLEHLLDDHRKVLSETDESQRVLWSLADSDDRFETASGLLLARRDDDDTNLLRQSVLEVLEAIAPAHPRDVRKWLQQYHGYAGSSRNINAMLYTLFDEDRVDRDEDGRYVLIHT